VWWPWRSALRADSRAGILRALSRAIDALALLLFAGATAALAGGLLALERQDDFRALYLLAVGALSLRASTQILRPRGSA
jgi:hypothetical protein